jgi:iron complex transport system substrate-binding protein
LNKIFFIRFVISIIILTSSFLFISCKKEEFRFDPEGLSIRDDLGNVINFDTPPQRIISLAPNITEALFAINAGDRVVGVTKFCDYPPEAKLKTNTGGMLDPDYEIMASLNPDLVIMTVEGNSQPTYQALERLGMKIFVTNPRSIEGIFDMITELGRITGNNEEAENLVSTLRNEKNAYLDSLKNETKKNFLMIISVNPLMSACGSTYLNDVIELAGFNNIYKDEKLDYPVINREELVKKDFEFIILPVDTSDTERTERMKSDLRNELSNFKPVNDSDILLLDANILFRPGPRILEGVRILKSKSGQDMK